MNSHLEKLKEKLLLKNYPENVIMKQFEKANVKDRKSLIYRQRPERNKMWKTNIVTKAEATSETSF